MTLVVWVAMLIVAGSGTVLAVGAWRAFRRRRYVARVFRDQCRTYLPTDAAVVRANHLGVERGQRWRETASLEVAYRRRAARVGGPNPNPTADKEH